MGGLHINVHDQLQAMCTKLNVSSQVCACLSSKTCKCDYKGNMLECSFFDLVQKWSTCAKSFKLHTFSQLLPKIC
jgi:hypothetical protein